jgi:hypothetical protein
MSAYPSVFNSSEMQIKDLILDEKYGIKPGNIFAHLRFMNVVESL